uniref:Uncharacterized protein n=1 Tax=Meloidogyne enterolobii TaxID=390850 RepID=A0A6V7V331_MELEN|nr:unnamed protein product [Meloidogyne enterolobii]
MSKFYFKYFVNNLILYLFLIKFLFYLNAQKLIENNSNVNQNLLSPKSLLLKKDEQDSNRTRKINNNSTIIKKENDDKNDENEEENDEEESLSQIDDLFQNRKTFTCPLVKQLLATGSSTAELSPEDIDVVAAMGDALSARKKNLF